MSQSGTTLTAFVAARRIELFGGLAIVGGSRSTAPARPRESNMGFFDDAVQDAVPGGSLAKPIMIAIGALLLKNMLTKKSEPEPAPAPAPSPSLPPLGGDGGGLLGGLGDLVSKFERAGQGGTIGSWIGSGPNQPINPGQLGSTLGQTTISDLARQAGVSEQDLLNGLAQALPGVIDKLTPQGRLPTPAELSGR